MDSVSSYTLEYAPTHVINIDCVVQNIEAVVTVSSSSWSLCITDAIPQFCSVWDSSLSDMTEFHCVLLSQLYSLISLMKQ